MAIATDKNLTMKKLFILAGLLLMATVQTHGQRTIEKGGYLKDPNLDKFVGTWQGASSSDTLKVVFEKYKVYYEKPDAYMDLIIGWYKFIKDGRVVDDYLNRVGSSYKKRIFSGRTDDNKSTVLHLTVIDYKRDKSVNATFQLIQGQTDQAILKLQFSEGVYFYFDDEKPKNEVQTIPVPSTWKMRKIN